MRIRRIYLMLFALSLLLAACGSDAVRGDQSVLVGEVYLDCNQECRIHGSCGPSEETGKQVVLLGVEEPGFPGVSSVTFKGLNAGTAVEVMDTKVVAGVEQKSNQDVEIRFYAVTEGDTFGWVPGFCILNQAP